jgi:chromosome segregation ATPase
MKCDTGRNMADPDPPATQILGSPKVIEGDVIPIREEMQRKVVESEEMRGKIAEHEEKITELGEEMRERIAELLSTQEKIAELRREIREREEKIAEGEERNAELRRQIGEREEKIAELQPKIGGRPPLDDAEILRQLCNLLRKFRNDKLAEGKEIKQEPEARDEVLRLAREELGYNGLSKSRAMTVVREVWMHPQIDRT